MPEGAITWATGEIALGKGVNRVNRPVWKWIPPQDFKKGAKPRTLFAPPLGAKNIESNSPYDTIQIIGVNRKVPARIRIDLGWTDITVIKGKEIRFKGGGEDTNVGGRIGSTTQGMSLIPAAGEGVVERLGWNGKPAKVIKKRSHTQKRRKDRFDDITGLKGFRP